MHLIALAITGFNSLKRKPDEPEEQPPKNEQPREIYYIVEKKRPRKSSYSEPREINFKK